MAYPAGYWAELVRSSSSNSLVETTSAGFVWLRTSDGEPLEQEYLRSGTFQASTLDTTEPDQLNYLDSSGGGTVLRPTVSTAGVTWRFRKAGEAWIPSANGILITSITWNGASHRFFSVPATTQLLNISSADTQIANISLGETAIQIVSLGETTIWQAASTPTFPQELTEFTITAGSVNANRQGYAPSVSVGSLTSAADTVQFTGKSGTTRTVNAIFTLSTTSLRLAASSGTPSNDMPHEIRIVTGSVTTYFTTPSNFGTIGLGERADYTRDARRSTGAAQLAMTSGTSSTITLYYTS